MSATQVLLTVLVIALTTPTIPYSVLIFIHTRASERRHREEQAEARDALANTLPHYRRAELDYIRLRLESPDTQAARQAHSASFRERSSANMALMKVRTAYTDPHIRMLAHRAFDLTGELHYAETPEQAAKDAAKAIEALHDFVTTTGATVRSTTPQTDPWPPTTEKPLPQPSADTEMNSGQKDPHAEPDPA
ncbi:hypothetical protein [Actinomadura madurae]|uniref:hypothetical protein n=1 Tax=Actinomadura madurae TaxID=1993 RepID=UPI002026C097|nr:hypothetical protein [Actinomadura madurae]MCP9950554.1 hypothetical protein [Actinomadura madurae]MCP9979793.1 hypothetical protein [Actinomadura madurae]MCQ0008677.1 hypothetical protein [Actinomadura madurae]MCQ0015998.1 hypothetical protein [Actinomadura madurae]URN06800.1 hypothetical protein LUW74_28090 [Actinomadura madurae]